MTAEGDCSDARRKRLTQEELEKHIARLTVPPRPVEVRDPFPVCPTVHISRAELEKMTERLFTQSVQRKEATRQEGEHAAGRGAAQALQREPLTPEALDSAVDRLYTQSLERKKQTQQESRQRRELPKKPTKTVPLSDFVQHMYFDQLAAQKKMKDKLYQRYILSTEIRSRRIAPSELAQSAERLSSKN